MTVTEDRPARRDAVRNREQLLRAAGRVFAERGLDAGVEEVARAAGLGVGTLYRHFPTKDHLIGALVDEILTGLLAAAEEAVSAPDGSGLERFLQAAASVHAAHRGCLPRLWSMSREGEAQQRIRRLISRMLTDAKRHGRARSDLVETDITMIFWSLRGVIETTGATAPDAWKRHLSLLISALHPGGPALARPPVSRAEVERVMSGGR